MMWTQFMDMHSGGGTKIKGIEYVYIEAPEEEAVRIFYSRFGHNPHRVSCTCCGADYSLAESPSLEEATAFERGCAYVYVRPDGTECNQSEAFERGKGVRAGYIGRYVERQEERAYRPYCTLQEYLKKPDIQIIYSQDIQPHERLVEVPEQGYVWH